MRDRTHRHLHSRCPGRITANARFRFLAAVLLLLGVVAWSGLTSLHAQPPQAPTPSGPPVPTAPPPPDAAPPPQPTPPPPLPVKIDPKTPLKDLLPAPPKIKRRSGPLLTNDLSRVPEVRFQAPHNAVKAEARQQIAYQIVKINHLNDKKTDGFIEALRSERIDVSGLPFAMGDACRTKGERSKQFTLAVATVRRALQTPQVVPVLPPSSAPSVPVQATSPMGQVVGSPTMAVLMASASPSTAPSPTTLPPAAPVAQGQTPEPEAFWASYQNLCTQEDKTQTHACREQRETLALARIAALTQMLMPMKEMQPGLAKYLSGVSHIEATRALARLAIFSADEETRKAAIDALKVRRERDYTAILVAGLRYPWPAVARRAAEAIAKLERNDLLLQLIEVLEEDDPRTPLIQEVKDKRVPVVRELVRVNHHRSCLLCHAPGNTGKVSGDTVSAEVPVPGQPLNPPSSGYGTSQPDLLVRVDVTYLRQDFSAFQAVTDANPWPEMQRFDYLVRSRVVSAEEATTYREKLKPREEGQFSPYQRAALTALRDLTGRDTEPTPEAWRRLLKLTTRTP